MPGENTSYFDSNIPDHLQNLPDADKPFAAFCALYFPPNRFEEPAWLNSSNLNARAEYVDASLIAGDTARTAIALTSLKANQNWLFDLIYDRAAFELNIAHIPVPAEGTDSDRVSPSVRRVPRRCEQHVQRSDSDRPYCPGPTEHSIRDRHATKQNSLCGA